MFMPLCISVLIAGAVSSAVQLPVGTDSSDRVRALSERSLIAHRAPSFFLFLKGSITYYVLDSCDVYVDFVAHPILKF